MPEPIPKPESDASATTRSLWGLLGALGLLAVLAGGGVWFLSKSDSTGASSTSSTGAGALLIPSVAFTDVTHSAGITFQHVNGATGDKFLPETMGGGVAFFDYDADGRPDLLFINSGPWTASAAATGARPGAQPSLALYHNETSPRGEPRFRDVTAGSGLEVALYGMGVAVGDYDNDGLPDLYVTAVGRNRLFRNLGNGRFEDVTASTGVGGSEKQWSTAAAWMDIDNDGDLDLLVLNYVEWSPDLDRAVNNQLAGVGRAYGRPWSFPGTLPRLYRNDGGGRFTDVTKGSGLEVRNPATGLPMAKSLAVAPIDLNNDGFIDFVVANDTVQNFVFTNRHDGTFAEVGVASGVAFDPYGQTRGAMGIDAARFRNDSTLGIAIGNFANEMNALYVLRPATRDLVFTDEAVSEGLGPASRQLLKFGLFFFDYDLDGRLDVLTANGHLAEEIERIQPGVHYRQPAQLFWNAGGAAGTTFVPVDVAHSGADLARPVVGRGSAYADIDGDGDPDVVITQINGPPMLLRNDQKLGHHWVRFQLRGTRSNRDAIGAWVTVRSGGMTQSRQVMPTRSYLSQSELPITFGLGGGNRVDEVIVTWPGGRTQTVDAVKLDSLNQVTEP